jgi:hypothetical protein
MTVGRATNVADTPKNDNENNGPAAADATNVAPAEFTGERAAKLVLRRETASADRIAKVIVSPGIHRGPFSAGATGAA